MLAWAGVHGVGFICEKEFGKCNAFAAGGDAESLAPGGADRVGSAAEHGDHADGIFRAAARVVRRSGPAH